MYNLGYQRLSRLSTPMAAHLSAGKHVTPRCRPANVREILETASFETFGTFAHFESEGLCLWDVALESTLGASNGSTQCL